MDKEVVSGPKSFLRQASSRLVEESKYFAVWPEKMQLLFDFLKGGMLCVESYFS
jgi:hypothetical protein